MQERGSDDERIPLLDLKAQYRSIRDDIRNAVDRVLESQGFILGPEVAQLETALAEYLEVPHAIGVSSGSDALVVSLRALDVGTGDAVLTPAYSFFATAGAAGRLGAVPVFLDVEPDTLNLDPEALARYLETQTETRDSGGKPVTYDRKRKLAVKAVIPVHLFGQAARMDRILALCRPRGIQVVEDAAQSIGARFQGRLTGSFGIAGCFSFYPTKNLGGVGDGGLVTTTDAGVAERIRRLRDHGAQPRYFHHEVGFNFRLDTIQAAVLLVKLKHLDDWTHARQAVAARYDSLFKAAGLDAGSGGPVQLPFTATGATCVFHQYSVRVDGAARSPLAASLDASGITTTVYYPGPLHLQTCFRSLGYVVGDLPVSEKACEQSLALPMYPELTERQQERIVSAISAFFGSRAGRSKA